MLVTAQASEDLEDRESLAQIAASQSEPTSDGETYIEKYIKGVSAVESILALDKLRQVSEKQFHPVEMLFLNTMQNI